MKLIETIRKTKTEVRKLREQGLSIGFVPTMGALHEGHLELVRKSVKENNVTVCSIFINPIQFNNPNDLEKYPRSIDRDAEMLAKEGCDILFAPSVTEMYPENEMISIDVDFGMLDKIMEGKFRPGHFKGVAIVVKKLFGIIEPSRAYFGKKDYQQLAIIRQLVNTLMLPIDIIPCETVRETDGLAMSSRNIRLTIAERNLAPKIYKVLTEVREKKGKMPIRKLKEWAIKKIQENPELKVEYFEIAEKNTLMPVETWSHKDQFVALTAVFLGDIRLIDNIELF